MTNKIFISMEKNPVFTCPHCLKHQSHQWYYIHGPYGHVEAHTLKPTNPRNELDPYEDGVLAGVIKSTCNDCGGNTFWLKSSKDDAPDLQIYPSNFVDYPPPHVDLPKHLKKTFIEAGSIALLSPGASAALARLTLENLLKHLGYKQNNLNDKIKEFVKEHPNLQKTMDVIRVYGNSGAHSGIINLDENKDVPLFLLKLINIVAEQTISIPESVDSLYETIPEGIKQAIAKRDGVN